MKRGPIIFCGVLVVCGAGAMVEWSNFVDVTSEVAERESYNRRDGKQEAEADIARGTPKWKVHGLVHNYEQRAAALRESIGIELDWFQGCIGSQGIARYTYEYNSAMWPHLVEVFGDEVTRENLGDKPRDRSSPEEEANQSLQPTPQSRGG